MADTDSLDLDGYAMRADLEDGLREEHAVALISYARSLESQLAESQQENEVLRGQLLDELERREKHPKPGDTRPKEWGTCAGDTCDNDAALEVFIWPNYPNLWDGCGWVPVCASCKASVEAGNGFEYVYEAHGFLAPRGV